MSVGEFLSARLIFVILCVISMLNVRSKQVVMTGNMKGCQVRMT